MPWHFGPFRLDQAQAGLWRAEQPVPLRPKTLALLAYLVQHAGQLVTKEALLDAVWPETAVGDGVLKTGMNELRKALGETARAPQWIATVHGRGYRFVAPVTVIDLPEMPHPGEPLQRTAPVPLPQGALPPTPEVLVPQEGTDFWRCAVCQHPQSRATRFCMACGAPRAETCVTCGQVVPLPATFCPGCGHRLGGLPAPIGERPLGTVQERAPLTYTPTALVEKIRTARTALEGERKQVTVLFADLTDALALIRDLDPEAAQQLLDPALHAMMDAVHRYEGTVNQVLGDGIMALLGRRSPMRTTPSGPVTPP